MIKKIKDLTKEDCDSICKSTECQKCQLNTICSLFPYYIISSFRAGDFDKDVEVPEGGKK